MVAQAVTARPADDVRFVQGAAEDLPFDSASFDLVVSSMSFHHWADQRAGLGEIRRVLAPGGLFALADGVAIGWLRLAFRMTVKRERVHTPLELDSMLAAQALRTIGCGVLPRMGGASR
jgi:ubiquinone/menaquinone biosynthesis C-methylase UbiE